MLSAAVRPALIEVLDMLRAARAVLFPPCCRFVPTCSEYAREALEKLPLHEAFLKTAWRLLRCHPFHPGGHDPLAR